MCQKQSHKPVRLLVAKDGSSADLLIPAEANPEETTYEWCLHLLHEASIVVTSAVSGRMREVLDAYEPGVEIRECVATGTPVQHGVDGHIEWYEGFAPASPKAAASGETAGEGDSGEGEPVCFYSRSAFIMVEAGQKIGRIVPETEGADGADVHGQVVAARPGKPVKVRCEDSISVGDDGTMTSQVSGVLSRSREKIAVRELLEIPGSVDFSTGNIDFEGDVRVLKGIRDIFEVRATGNIEVGGLIEASTIDAGGSVFAKGGMAGRERAVCRAGGDVTIRYLDSSEVTVGGTLRFEREMINCKTLVRGGIESPSGSIIGGEATVVGKVVVAVLGSNSYVPTRLSIGGVPTLESKLALLEKMIEALRAKQEKLEKGLKKLNAPGRILNGEEQRRQTELGFEVHSVAAQRAKCRDSHRELSERIRSIRTVDVCIEKMLYAGVRIVFGTQVYRINMDLKGPVRILLDRRGGLVYRMGSEGQNTPLGQIAEVRAAAA